MITYAIGLRNRFRGITVREGMLFEGPAGWAEWSPFLEYDDATCVSWLRAAREAAVDGWPAPLRSAVPVNCTVAGDRPHAGCRDRAGFWLCHCQGQGGRTGADPCGRPGAR